MKYGCCVLSVVPLRQEPSDTAEMVSQLLFGDAYAVLEERTKWLRIRMHYDQYEGWIDRKQHEPLSEAEITAVRSGETIPLNPELVSLVREVDGDFLPVVLGSSLPGLSEQQLTIGSRSFRVDGTPWFPSGPAKSALPEHAYLYLNAPYLWGGRSPFGIDCSGFTQMVYKMVGFALPRDAHQQAELGETLSFVEEAEPGDLAFFDNAEGAIIHVGMLLEENHIIHASGKVRVDRIDHQGIYNRETRSYSHQLRLIKRMLPE